MALMRSGGGGFHLFDSFFGLGRKDPCVVGVPYGVREHQHIRIKVDTHPRNLIAKLIASVALLVVHAVGRCQFGLQILGVLPQFPFPHFGGRSAGLGISDLLLQLSVQSGYLGALLRQLVALACQCPSVPPRLPRNPQLLSQAPRRQRRACLRAPSTPHQSSPWRPCAQPGEAE